MKPAEPSNGFYSEVGEEQTSTSDTREVWPSRLSFILASMGGAVGVGNLIRYPSIALRHSGLQWFIPYLGALLVIGLPILGLEIAIGQAYRVGNVVAFNRINKHLRGVGLSAVFLGYIASTYYVVILAWILTYLRHSFRSPIPWKADNAAFFEQVVHQNPAPVPAYNATLTAGETRQYAGLSFVPETIGWTGVTWLLVYLSLFRGVSLTGRVVYVTMLLPLVTSAAILVRAVTLPGAMSGVLLYIGEWHTSKLLRGQMWKDAVIQIFYSVGTGFGIFTAYASYNPRAANAVQDLVIVACCNSLIEMFAAFAAFGVIGHLGIDPATAKLGTFQVGFITYPTALAGLPFANVWAALFFFTLYLLGIDSAFAYLEGLTTAVIDSVWGRRLRKSASVGIITLLAFALSLMYTTSFGYYLLDAVDTWVTGIALMLSTWMECVGATSLYRYRDVVAQTGVIAFFIANLAYVSSMVVGVVLGNVIGSGTGLLAFLCILFGGTFVAVLFSKRPEVIGPWGGRKLNSSLWWLTSYSVSSFLNYAEHVGDILTFDTQGHQLSLDLNAIVAGEKNWGLPVMWAPVLRWVAAPTLITILSISYADFPKYARDPLHVFAFIFAHFFVLVVIVGIIVPQSLSIWISEEHKGSHMTQYTTSPAHTLPSKLEYVIGDDVEFNVEESETEESF